MRGSRQCPKSFNKTIIRKNELCNPYSSVTQRNPRFYRVVCLSLARIGIRILETMTLHRDHRSLQELVSNSFRLGEG